MTNQTTEEGGKEMGILKRAHAGNPFSGFVAGCWYRAVILGTPFEFWVGGKLARKELRQAAIDFANGDYPDATYDLSCVDSVRRISP